MSVPPQVMFICAVFRPDLYHSKSDGKIGIWRVRITNKAQRQKAGLLPGCVGIHRESYANADVSSCGIDPNDEEECMKWKLHQGIQCDNPFLGDTFDELSHPTRRTGFVMKQNPKSAEHPRFLKTIWTLQTAASQCSVAFGTITNRFETAKIPTS